MPAKGRLARRSATTTPQPASSGGVARVPHQSSAWVNRMSPSTTRRISSPSSTAASCSFRTTPALCHASCVPDSPGFLGPVMPPRKPSPHWPADRRYPVRRPGCLERAHSRDLVAVEGLLHFKIVVGLDVATETLAHAEIAGEPNCSVAGEAQADTGRCPWSLSQCANGPGSGTDGVPTGLERRRGVLAGCAASATVRAVDVIHSEVEGDD